MEPEFTTFVFTLLKLPEINDLRLNLESEVKNLMTWLQWLVCVFCLLSFFLFESDGMD